MILGEYAAIRTGFVLSRKEASPEEGQYIYHTLSLKNMTKDGQILLTETENYYASEALKKEYFTHIGDVLLRLSAPYTAAVITKKEADLLIPSHFAIIRADKTVEPYYLCWWLMNNRKRIYKNASGGTMMGTISSGYVAEMTFEPPPFEKQRIIGKLFELANREQQLLVLLGVKKKQLIDAILINTMNEGEKSL